MALQYNVIIPNALTNAVIAARVTKDAVSRHTDGGTRVTNISVVVARRYQVDGEWKDQSRFLTVTVWGDAAARAADIKKNNILVIEFSVADMEAAPVRKQRRAQSRAEDRSRDRVPHGMGRWRWRWRWTDGDRRDRHRRNIAERNRRTRLDLLAYSLCCQLNSPPERIGNHIQHVSTPVTSLALRASASVRHRNIRE